MHSPAPACRLSGLALSIKVCAMLSKERPHNG